MSETMLQTQVDAANTYEQLFVPALFSDWAKKFADHLSIHPGLRILDVACGTGVLARQVALKSSPGGYTAGLDANLGMLTVAERLAPRIEWRQGMAESLPFPDQSFDLVVSQFGLMFFNDRPRALREMLRVLIPGGQLAVLVWNDIENIPAYAIELELLERLAGRQAADALRAPFLLGDKAELRSLFKGAGVRSVDIHTYKSTAHFPSIRVMVEADLRGWLPMMGVVLTEEQIANILEEAEKALATYQTNDGRVRFKTSAHLIKGSRDQM